MKQYLSNSFFTIKRLSLYENVIYLNGKLTYLNMLKCLDLFVCDCCLNKGLRLIDTYDQSQLGIYSQLLIKLINT